MELFDVVDENGMPTGEIIERSEAHRLGKPHRTSHVWIVRKKGERVEILLQILDVMISPVLDIFLREMTLRSLL